MRLLQVCQLTRDDRSTLDTAPPRRSALLLPGVRPSALDAPHPQERERKQENRYHAHRLLRLRHK